MALTLQQFVNKYDGKSIRIPGYDTDECVAEFWAFNRECGNGEQYSAPGASDLWKLNWDDYEKITGQLQPGDQCIWGGWPGHVALYLGADQGDTSLYLSQNPGPCRIQRLNNSGIIGALRLKTLRAGQVGNLTLPASATQWAVYPEGVQPVKGNQVGYLYPAKFGGLTYQVKGWTIPGTVALIDTRDYGRVQIYVAPGTGAQLA